LQQGVPSIMGMMMTIRSRPRSWAFGVRIFQVGDKTEQHYVHFNSTIKKIFASENFRGPHCLNLMTQVTLTNQALFQK